MATHLTRLVYARKMIEDVKAQNPTEAAIEDGLLVQIQKGQKSVRGAPSEYNRTGTEVARDEGVIDCESD